MIPNTHTREVKTNGVTASSSFGISHADTAHIMSILRDTLYSNKILAVLREYSANAWDAHRDAGKPDLPIHVTLPTKYDHSLKIRDFGKGLSHDEVFRIYTQYGASTKRNSDNSVGMLGIGSKSGFAYSDTFTIISWNGGMKRTYAAVLDKTEKGLINLLGEESCGEETGVEIRISTKPHDKDEFESTAANLFRYFVPQPVINTVLPSPLNKTLKNGHVYRDDSCNWIAVMGCIPYRVNMEQLQSVKGNGLPKSIKNLSGVMNFDIGQVQINASREELKYSDFTKEALVAKYTTLVDEFVEAALRDVETSSVSPWDRRLKVQTIVALGIDVPKRDNLETERHVRLSKALPKTFTLSRGEEADRAVSVAVDERTTLHLRDTRKSLKGYSLELTDYLVSLRDRHTWDEAITELDAFLAESKMTGIPIKKLSTRTWVSKSGSKTKTFNAKHTATMFRCAPHNGYVSLGSRGWDIVTREPTDDDVFVILDRFDTANYNFRTLYGRDYTLASLFKSGPLPVVYGYKSTEKKPVHASSCKGTEYKTWSETKFIPSLVVAPKLHKLFQRYLWSKTLERHGVSEWRYRSGKALKSTVKRAIKALVLSFGKDHPLTKVTMEMLVSESIIKNHANKALTSHLRQLEEYVHDPNPISGIIEPYGEIDDALKTYPMISSLCDLFRGVDDLKQKTVDYVKMVDHYKELTNAK